MLIAQKSCGSHRYSSRVVVFLLRYLTKVLGIRLCEELDGSLLLVPDRSRDAPDWPPCASPDHYKERNTTRPAHRDAVSQTPERAAATALARRLPLATPSRSHNWQHSRPRVCAFDGRAFNSLEFTTRRLSALRSAPSLYSVPSWKTIAHLVIHFNNPNTPTPRPPIKPQLAVCKTLAQQAQGRAAAQSTYCSARELTRRRDRSNQKRCERPGIGRIRSAASVSSLIPCG